MKKKSISFLLCIFMLLLFLPTVFAVEPLSSEEVVAQKRAWYPFIKTCEEKLNEKAKSESLQDIKIDRIIVESVKYLTTENEVNTAINEKKFVPNITIYIHFSAIHIVKVSKYIYTYMPQNDYENLYNETSSNLTVSNYNTNNSILSGDFDPSFCTFLGDEYVYNSALSGRYYIALDIADYKNHISTTVDPTVSEPSTSEVKSSSTASGFLSKETSDSSASLSLSTEYTKGQEIIISGKTDFNYFYTYRDGLKYKCFSLTKNGERVYASVREDLYDYYKNAFQNHSLTLKGTYEFTAEDGSPVVSVSTLVEGTKETNLRSYLWTVNKGSVKNPNFKAYADLKGDGLVLSAAKDGQSITIDSNPWGAAKGSQAYKLDNDFALLMIKELNSELGLPDWLYTEMMGTRALDGRQKEVFDYVTIIWSYHPDSGINILYRKNN